MQLGSFTFIKEQSRGKNTDSGKTWVQITLLMILETVYNTVLTERPQLFVLSQKDR